MVDVARVLLVATPVATRTDLAARPEQPAEAQPPAPPALPATPEIPAPAQAPVIISGSEIPAPGRIIVNGKEITVGAGGGEIFTNSGMPFPPDIPPGVQSIATTAIVSFALMVAAFPLFGYLKALVNRRANTQQALPSRDITDRLNRIESAVDAMSVEVERISEGQRFVTKVLTERSSAPGLRTPDAECADRRRRAEHPPHGGCPARRRRVRGA